MARTFVGVSMEWRALLTYLLQRSPLHLNHLSDRCIKAQTTLDAWYQRCQTAAYEDVALAIVHNFVLEYPQLEQLEVVPLASTTSRSYVIGLPLPVEMEVELLNTQLPQAKQLFRNAGLPDILRLYTL